MFAIRYRFAGALLPCLALASTSLFVSAQEESLQGAIRNGSYTLNLRFRHEAVEQDNMLRDASAGTLLTRLTLNSGKVRGFGALLEIDNVSAIGSDSYDSFVLDQYRGRYAVIADPTGTEVNQALISYALDDTQTLLAGRQRINHANQRFVGGVAWRQNEQTYDALSWRNRIGSLELDYSYVWNVNSIFNSSSPSVQLSDLDSDSHIMLGKFTRDWGSVSAFGYVLDFDNAAARSSATWGLSYAGKLGPVSLNATVAEQQEHGDNPVSYNAGYFSADAAINAGAVKLLAGYEVLGSDDGLIGFSTPLATLHVFQGWTDLFLATPAAGVEDAYVTLSGTLKGLALAATWHELRSEEGNIDYGTEWDLVASYSFNSMFSTQLKFATYDSDNFAVDTDKLWFTLNFSF